VLIFDINPGTMSRVICVAAFKIACCTDLHERWRVVPRFRGHGQGVDSRRFSSSVAPVCGPRTGM